MPREAKLNSETICKRYNTDISFVDCVLCDKVNSYLIFVIFSPQVKILAQIFSTQNVQYFCQKCSFSHQIDNFLSLKLTIFFSTGTVCVPLTNIRYEAPHFAHIFLGNFWQLTKDPRHPTLLASSLHNRTGSSCPGCRVRLCFHCFRR